MKWKRGNLGQEINQYKISSGKNIEMKIRERFSGNLSFPDLDINCIIPISINLFNLTFLDIILVLYSFKIHKKLSAYTKRKSGLDM